MSVFTGGSPFAMVRDIGEGFILLSKPKLKQFSINDMQRLKEELEKSIRSLRGSPPPSGEQQEIQKHNRKLQRVTSALRVLQMEMTARQRKG